MYLRNIFVPIKYPYKLPSYSLYCQELNIYKRMFNPYKKSVHFEHFETKSDESDESESDSEKDEDSDREEKNWLVKIFSSFYNMFKYAGKYSYIFFRNMVVYIYLFPYPFFKSYMIGSCVGVGIYYFIRHK